MELKIISNKLIVKIIIFNNFGNEVIVQVIFPETFNIFIFKK